jgi:acyl-[acyl carrier protein]--UDP-N-acetylglucosamine O-acyltransferase
LTTCLDISNFIPEKFTTMKKLLFLLALFIPVFLIAQPCLPGGITFYQQSEIDNFQTDFPNCTEIEGDVTIRGADIVNLAGLNVINSIIGSLNIKDNFSLTSLSGLDSLGAIGGYLWISDHAALASLTGLEKLTSINGFCLIGNNAVLTSLTGLNNLTHLGALEINANPVLSSLSGLGNLVKIESNLSVTENAMLNDLSGLNELDSIVGPIYFAQNDNLTSLTGLNDLKYIGGDVDIILNNALINFTGLENLTTVGGHIWIADNAALKSLSGLYNLTSINGYLMLKYNVELNNIKGLDNIEAASIDSLIIVDNYSLNSCVTKSICNFLASPGGNIVIQNNAPGCNSQDEVEKDCEANAIIEQTSPLKLRTSPNPFIASTTIQYELDQPETVRISFYNQFNFQIDIIEKRQLKGLNKVVWTPENLADGIYYFRLVAGEQVASGKMALMR